MYSKQLYQPVNKPIFSIKNTRSFYVKLRELVY